MKLSEALKKYGDQEISEEQIKKLGISKVWKPKKDEEYWFIGNERPCSEEWTNHIAEEFEYSIGNCFKTREEAEFMIEKLKVIAELKRFAEEHNDYEMNWDNINQNKWYIYYDCNNHNFKFDYYFYYKIISIYFTSEEIAKAAIEAIGEDRLRKYYFEVKE